ncbi:unnamed protein product [Brugia timori]|uniref:Secreted protein n=1 Tax=Brugia timori TaxID=42155 RepID=A0A0R3QH57_9BILA|nr:unnamed protein product [Brugia timori]
MTKLLVYIAFIIYCGGQAANQAARPVVAGMHLSFFVTSLPGMFIMKYKSRYALCAFRNISKISAETAFDGGSNFSSNATYF